MSTLSRNILVAVVTLASLAALAFITSNRTSACTIEDDRSILSLSFTDTKGTCHTLVDDSSELTVVNAWASWCPFCVEELPDFARLSEEFKNISVVAVNRNEPRDKAQEFIDSLPMQGEILFLFDDTDAFYRAIGGFSMPETVFLSPEGEVIFHKRGFMSYEEMQGKVNEAIESINGVEEMSADTHDLSNFLGCLGSRGGICISG